MAEPQNYDDADDPYRAIRVGDPGAASEATKWGYLLTLFMRVMAGFWMLQGLAQWYALLTAPQSIFDTAPQGGALAVIFFGVLDLVAGVGLWLATPWGGVLWLLIASAQIFVAASLPELFAGGYFLVAVDLVLIGLYFWLTFEAGRDFEGKRLMQHRWRKKGLPANDRQGVARLPSPAKDLDAAPAEEPAPDKGDKPKGAPLDVIQALKKRAAKAANVKRNSA
jgi:hypothetical protein